MDAYTTLGVEEEFLVVDDVGAPVAAAPAVLAALPPSRFKPELQLEQLEAVTAPHVALSSLDADLFDGRRQAAAAADSAGVYLHAIGAPLLAPPARTPDAAGRPGAVHATYAAITDRYLACGCHVHVGVADFEDAVAVVNQVRPWLPVLLALSANSPMCGGVDTGYASWRVVEQSRFPGFGVPPHFDGADDYEARVAKLVECGVLVDERMSFWLVRPSPVYPTVEFRVADAAASVDDAVLQAALCRGLVRTALRDVRMGVAPPRIDSQVAAAAVWTAARHGTSGPAIDMRAEVQVPMMSHVEELVAHIAEQLDAVGDLQTVRTLVDLVRERGCGAQRQRRVAREGVPALAKQLRVT